MWLWLVSTLQQLYPVASTCLNSSKTSGKIFKSVSHLSLLQFSCPWFPVHDFMSMISCPWSPVHDQSGSSCLYSCSLFSSCQHWWNHLCQQTLTIQALYWVLHLTSLKNQRWSCYYISYHILLIFVYSICSLLMMLGVFKAPKTNDVI